MSDSSQGSGAGPGTPKPAPAKSPAISPRAPTPPIKPKAPAQGVRPLAQSSHDHSVPEARRAREPLPDDATVPMTRERAASMPNEDEWTNTADVSAKVLAQSPKPGAVVGDAHALRQALLEALEPLQHALDDLTVKIARERVDRKEAIERLERTVARVATGNPPPVQTTPTAPAAAVAATTAHKPPPVQTTPFLPATNFAPIKSPFAEASTTPMFNPEARAAALAGEAPPAPVVQPFSVSPSANPPPVAPNEPPVAIPAAAAVPQIETAAENTPDPAPAPAPVPKAAAPAPVVHVPVVVTPSTIPVKIDFDYSTDLSFDLPPGLDMGRRRRRMAWIVAILVIGGAIAMIASMLISRSQGPGAL